MDVILDFGGRRRAFRGPRQVIAADRADQVAAALSAASDALAAGFTVAGWLAYELGYALEPRLAPLLSGPQPLLRLGVFDGESAAPAIAGRAYAGPLRPDWDAGAYGARFDRVKALIAAGDIYQANLALRARFAFAGDALALYERLLAASGAGHAAYVDDGVRRILSLSPELFFALDPDGVLTTRPMKGTAPRGDDDAAARAALAASPKDRAENLMIVDLIRNDLGRVAELGSVTVRDLFQVETYPSLHAMVSTVTARRRPGAGLGDMLRALFPCGSVTGAPKIRAMEVLHALEGAPRGAYCGAVGLFEPDGTAHVNVAIRTLMITGDEGVLGLGGGVVQDSKADAEYAECLLKGRFFSDPRVPLALIETFKWVGGFARLDAHLARMAASATRFGLPFDGVAARAALAAVTGEGPLRVRLALDEAGVFSVTTAPLPSNPPHWRCRIADARVTSTDLFQRHKTSWRALYDAPLPPGVDEMVFLNERGEVAEGARSTLFVKRDGMLWTPPLEAGALPGILRAELLAAGQAREAVLTPDDLMGEAYCGNSLRGLIAMRLDQAGAG
jgi:para-aminobenzoate synthetase/4-amino-4-deoxychorismate lyase